MALHDHYSLAEVGLGILAGIIGQGNEDLIWRWAAETHVITDGGLTTQVAFLPHETVINAPGGVMLLGRTEPVPGQPFINNGNVWPEYRPDTRPGDLVMGGTAVPDGRPDSAPAVSLLPGYPAYTFPFNEEGPAYLLFLVHFKHPFPPVSVFLPAYRIPLNRWVSF